MKKIIGSKIIYYKEIDSTSDEAKRLIMKGVGEGIVIVADSQTKGRGKPGCSWFSPPGVGVYLSAIVRPYKNPSDLAPITLLGAKAVVKTIEEQCKLEAKIKLPNDVMLNNKKVCGVLVERDASGNLIIGIGANINNAEGSFPDEIKDSATSLKIECGKDCSIKTFVDMLINELDNSYRLFLKNEKL
jgi:BirA family biotin operon repressor/biotin-[acetyl-CoA-carboxylase] ligase